MIATKVTTIRQVTVFCRLRFKWNSKRNRLVNRTYLSLSDLFDAGIRGIYLFRFMDLFVLWIAPLISSIKHLPIKLWETKRVPFSNIVINNCFPRLSMKLMCVKSTEIAFEVVDADCQHSSSTSTELPESFPSRQRCVAARSW